MGHTAARQPIRIAVDGRSLNRAHVRGIGRYLLRILQAPPRPDEAPLRWTVYGDRPDLPVWIESSEHVDVKIFECRGDRFQAWEQLALPANARRSSDVLFCPGVTGPAWQPIPTVIAVHDIIPWLMEDESMPAGFYRDRVLPRAYASAAALVAPSQSSVHDIVARWPSLQPRLHMIPLGVDETFLTAQPGPLPDSIVAAHIKRPYLLYVGGEIPRKRLDWALDVWRDATAFTVHFVACGVNAHAQDAIRERLPPESRSMIYFANYLPDSEMPALYMNAAAVLYPTMYEGFGFPAVEAQACGTPVLFSAVGSLAELAGPGAAVLPADDKAAWVAACRRLIQERAVAPPRPNDSAREWAAQFSWRSTADRQIDVLAAVANRRQPAPLERAR
ncbi:MAG TPA: glycosyltransferase family 1 protein [Vicinamibacterales bacterium]|nr:glycosyltransferase family 1 protein [Vicinamibacterales bacterium]